MITESPGIDEITSMEKRVEIVIGIYQMGWSPEEAIR